MDSQDRVNDQLAMMHAKFAAGPAAQAIATFAIERARIGRLARVADAAPPGDVLPDVELLSVRGEPTRLEGVRAGRAAVLVFYRGAWCPYCNLALRVYDKQLVPALAELNIPLIAISPQKPDGSLSAQEANGLSYTVLSDPGNALARRLGILAPETSDAVRAVALGLGSDVAAANADGTDRLPMPTVLVIDDTGVIRWIDVHPDYTTRSEPQDIQDAALALSGHRV